MKTKLNLSKNRFTTYEFTIPEFYLCAIMLGDYSGLTNDEEIEIRSFIDSVAKKFGHSGFIYSECESWFSHINDINNLGSNVTRILLNVPNPNYNV